MLSSTEGTWIGRVLIGLLKEDRMFKKLIAWFHRHPGIKTTAAGLLGAAATAAASGAFGPKAAVIAGAVVAVGGLHTKRPADATPEDKAAPAPVTP
jgi:hypothetical protein